LLAAWAVVERSRRRVEELPTSTTVQVSRLSRPEFMVEIEAFAIV